MRRIPELMFLLSLSATITFAQANSSGRGGTSMALALTSPAFAAGGEIPRQYTCKGADSSPALEWHGAPSNVASFAIIMDDPDAPHGTWVHLVMWNLPATAHELPEGLPRRAQLEDGASEGQNSFHKTGYNGPCPPGGQTHRYFFRLYALDAKLELSPTSDRASLDAAMSGHIVAQAEYMGTFHK